MEAADLKMEKAHRECRFCELNDLRALLFDWDGVLIDSGFNYYRAYELALQNTGIATNPLEIYLREGQLLATIFEQRGIPVTDSKIKELVERRREYEAALGERKFFDGVVDLLHRLRECGLRVGMVTGSSRKS